jgi:lysophospholipase L1-like esterase
MKSVFLRFSLFFCLCGGLQAQFYRIAIIGDSIGEGFGVEKNEGFVHRLGQDLRPTKKGLRIMNLGKGGLTTAAALDSLDEILGVAGSFKICILELGGNDFLTQVPADTVRANLVTLVERVRKHAPQAHLALVGFGYPLDANNPYQKAAAETGIKQIVGFDWEKIENKTKRLPDGIHPSAEAHLEISQRVKDWIQSLPDFAPSSHPSPEEPR